MRAIGKPIRVAAVPIRISQQAAIPAPPPVQAPAIAAIVGTRTFSSAPSTRSIRSSYSSASSAVLKARNCEMSVPDANALSPAPVRIIALIERSAFTVSQIDAICSYMAKVSALRACGRLNVSRAMPSSTE